MQNHAYSRLGISGAGAAVPSPPSSPRRAWGRRASAKGGWSARASAGAVRRVARAVLAALLRRQAVFLFAPLLYVAAMLLYMGSISLDSVPRIISRPAPGSVYRSPQLYARLRADMDADNATDAVSNSCASAPPSIGLGICACDGSIWWFCLIRGFKACSDVKVLVFRTWIV